MTKPLDDEPGPTTDSEPEIDPATDSETEPEPKPEIDPEPEPELEIDPATEPKIDSEPENTDNKPDFPPPAVRVQQPVAIPAGGDPGRFVDVLHSCVRSIHSHDSRPLCYSTLNQVKQDDVEAFRAMYPEESTQLQQELSEAMEKLHEDSRYRALGLHVALLSQGIDLTKDSHGPLVSGKAGEVSTRLSAVVNQGLRARDTKRDQTISTGATVTIAILATLLVIFFILFVGAVVMYLRHRKKL